MLLAEAFFAGCWWLRFRWLLVAGAYAPLATGGFTSAGNWWLHFRWQRVGLRVFHRSVESMIH